MRFKSSRMAFSADYNFTTTNMTAPILTPTAGTTNFIEGDNAVTPNYVIDPGISIADADSTTFASATVSITSGFQAGQDTLSLYRDYSLGTTGNITGRYVTSTGVLTLTSTGTKATLDQWQTAFHQITYINSSELPTSGDKTISFVLNDGASNSAVVSKTISVSAVNDATSFGVGRVTTDLGSSEFAQSVTVLPDGKILVAGTSQVGTGATVNRSFAEARYNPDGSLDTSFGNQGTQITEFINGAQGNVIYRTTMLPDGKTLAYGYVVNDTSTSPMDTRWAIARYNADGSLDTSFDADGKLTVDFRDYSSANGATIQPDGKILITGDHLMADGNLNLGIIRLNNDGSADTTFGIGGVVAPNFAGYEGGGGSQAFVLSDGKILIASTFYSSRGTDVGLVRLNSNGSEDTTFDGDGIATTKLAGVGVSERTYDAKLQADGKIVVLAGTYEFSLTGYRQDSVLLRYNADGSLDTSFSGDGKALVDATSTGLGNPLTLQADGKILVAGYSHGNFLVARYNTDGSLDSTFANLGQFSTDLGAGDVAYAVTLDASGKIIVAGGSNGNFAIARYNADGSIDASFSSHAQPALGGSVVLDAQATISDPEMALVGYNGSSLKLVRQGGASANDVFVARLGGTLGALTEGSNLTVDGTVIGTVLSNHGGTLTLSFSSNLSGTLVSGASQTLVNSALRQIAYSNSVDAAGTSVQIDWGFTDGNTGAQGPGGARTTLVSSSIKVLDTTAPTVSSFSPADESFGVSIGNSIVVTFSEAVTKGTGNFVLKTAAGATVATYDAATSTNLSISGNTLTINPTDDLAYSTDYKVEIPLGTIKDLAGNTYAGTTTYNFRTLDNTANQTFAGTSTSESFVSSVGNDSINGGAGIDAAVYGGSRANFTLTQTGSGFRLADKSGALGTDTLQNVERLKFSDGAIALDVGATQPAGQTALLMGAVLPGRLVFDASKQVLLGAAIDLFDQGYSLQTLSGAVMRLPIWDILTGNVAPTNTDIATYLLTNVNGVVPDATTLANAVASLSAETDFATQGNFLWHLAESTANQTHVGLVGLASTGLAYSV